ncbi:MAG: 50S ribosomal protein L15 [bacterium]|nr:50S ribosomal protein L15 [bacterium]
MKLHEMPSIIQRTRKRVGRGTSSGRGKTSGRGHKGDNARGSSPWYREGGSRRSRTLKHLPQVRGIGNLNVSEKPTVVSLAVLESKFSAGETVTLQTLHEKGVVAPSRVEVKVLGQGNLTKKLIVSVPVSASAKEAIERAGGNIQ